LFALTLITYLQTLTTSGGDILAYQVGSFVL